MKELYFSCGQIPTKVCPTVAIDIYHLLSLWHEEGGGDEAGLLLCYIYLYV